MKNGVSGEIINSTNPERITFANCTAPPGFQNAFIFMTLPERHLAQCPMQSKRNQVTALRSEPRVWGTWRCGREGLQGDGIITHIKSHHGLNHRSQYKKRLIHTNLNRVNY